MNAFDFIFFSYMTVAILSLVCWVRHMMWSIVLLTTDTGATVLGKYVLAVLGVFMPPIGAIHGFMIFLGIGA